ncbi:MAG: hypothetical protein A2W83_05550 [Sulfuricurvum sp. RIFCSPLOWO2_12_43_5]|nr:MAG: hypothetical protein A2697_02045 [Candidatus Curtissbacteria bacterium RIFCSPHIGHO2_01_FULL_41_44]OGD94641.1 MAG: hypothetical protein A3C33_01195 [Candidatus Curtissbacteria bacterium RIFCSPHIGHO2_02_FULL_42_58]OGE02226.1 MAG: hypothetical protein A3G16_01060 [Candidatus Curtissbacteria bacterium RIFCSPLOWO2_12_FULL_41_16]OGE11337.1 MAG: hypothetical protein A3H87_03850 [Candidatus Curtissbacteria bacterium RIFCSPLOWO2_02_FULL_42_37]OHD87318.1 MAG: hypothetical protein A2W83_05550 [Sul
MDKIFTRLTDKKQKLDRYQPLPDELVKNLEEWLKVELTYSSNAIEGNTLSRIETAEVIERGVAAVISGKPLKDQLEAINHAKAIEFIKELAKKRNGHQFITEQDILNIHKIILSGIQDDWAGKYRRTEVFIRGSDVQFPSPKAVPLAMKEFIDWLTSRQEEHPVKIAADAHFKFVSIHPFVDCNGRTTRLLMNLILILNGYQMAVIRNEDRTTYLNSFETARKKDDMQPFYNLVYTAVERSLDIYLDVLAGKQPDLKAFSSEGKNTVIEKSRLKIGELAKATGETIHTLRYWTKEGLLIVAEYSSGGYQLYDKEMVGIVKKIRQLQEKERRTLTEIKKLLKA